MLDAVLQEWRVAVGSDLRLFALLHDQEVDSHWLHTLKTNDFPHSLGLKLQQNDGQQALTFMAEAMAALPAEPDAAVLDTLAADYAAIYLNHTYAASPCESVWLDEEHLMRQQAMFDVREWYQRYGLEVENWRQRPDDHLVPQLEFLAHLCRLDAKTETLQHVAQFLDAHLLLWIKDFARQVQQRAETAYYVGIAVLTAAYLFELRGVLGEVVGVPVVEEEGKVEAC